MINEPLNVVPLQVQIVVNIKITIIHNSNSNIHLKFHNDFFCYYSTQYKIIVNCILQKWFLIHLYNYLYIISIISVSIQRK